MTILYTMCWKIRSILQQQSVVNFNIKTDIPLNTPQNAMKPNEFKLLLTVYGEF
jgi:hypothetical protein